MDGNYFYTQAADLAHISGPVRNRYVSLFGAELSEAAALRLMMLFHTDGSHHAVCVLNYTWHISGTWTFARHVSSSMAFQHGHPVSDQAALFRGLLPASALSRVLFLTHEELLGYLTPACLPSGERARLDTVMVRKLTSWIETSAVSWARHRI